MRMWEGSIGMDIKEIGVSVKTWIDLAQDRDYWRVILHEALNFWVLYAVQLVYHYYYFSRFINTIIILN